MFFLCTLYSIYSRYCSLARILCCAETIVAVEPVETIAGTDRLWMLLSEWASSSSLKPVNADSLVNNPPCVEAVLYRWRVKSLVRIRRLLPGNQYRLLHIEHLDRLASRVNYCARRFSCESVITHEYVIAFANEQLYRREAWDRYVDCSNSRRNGMSESLTSLSHRAHLATVAVIENDRDWRKVGPAASSH